ncbi:cellular nucleic acid-binding protein homolog [Diachasma alloeum]|uniref:cellular nucleic acid-binding protein homolog n=1 Tax=Diachasma alloeum TaxID=454923 RepID=UPI0007381978|nr:cellular nucleic acid-binding protein homolog [Diachasma alloeum]
MTNELSDSDIKTANYAQHKGPRCFACQAYGRKGPDCPNKGKGYLCYKCNQFGNHKARDCPNRIHNDSAPSGSGYSKQTPRK